MIELTPRGRPDQKGLHEIHKLIQPTALIKTIEISKDRSPLEIGEKRIEHIANNGDSVSRRFHAFKHESARRSRPL